MVIAAKQGMLMGCITLGDGVIQDYVQAHMWSNIARSNGSAKSEKLPDSAGETNDRIANFRGTNGRP